MRLITREWTTPLYYGGLVTGSGAGERSVDLIRLLDETLGRGEGVPLLDLDEINEQTVYMAAGLFGSMIERGSITGREGADALKDVSESCGQSPGGVFSIEAASLNVLYPVLVASIMGIPVIDGDCMGRAFPEFQMTTAHASGYRITPASIKTRQGTCYRFENEDNLRFELKAREILSDEVNIAAFAGLSVFGSDLRRILLPRTYSFIQSVGSCFIESSSYPELMEDLVEVTRNSSYGAVIELFIGTLSAENKKEEEGWRSLSFEGIGEYRGEVMKILMQNENLIAFRDQNLAAMVPDIIFFLDLGTLKPISNTEVVQGKKVAILGIPAPVRLKSPGMLALIGPGSFGYNKDYIPLERLYDDYYF